jgi:hypothetical protein
VAEVEKYITVRRTLKIVKGIADRNIYGDEDFGGPNGDDQVRNFGAYLDELLSIPELSQIEELKNSRTALSLYLKDEGFFRGRTHLKQAVRMMEANLRLALIAVEEKCKELRPYRNKPNRGIVVKLLSTYDERKRGADAESLHDISSELLGMLKSLVPGLEAEDVFIEARKILESGFDENDLLRRKVLLNNQMAQVIGKVMGEYEIVEGVAAQRSAATSIEPSATAHPEPKSLTPIGIVKKIREMLGSYTASNHIVHELENLGMDMKTIWGNNELGTRAFKASARIDDNVDPAVRINGTVYENDVINLLNEIENWQGKYMTSA